MRRSVWSGLLICLAAFALAPIGWACGQDVASDDTLIRLAPAADGIAIRSLGSLQPTREWISQDPSRLRIQFIDHVQINGKAVAVHWMPQPSSGDASRRSRTFHFVSSDPPLELSSEWRAAAGRGPVEHILKITNTGSQAVLVPRQTSLALTAAANQVGHAMKFWWVEKGGGTPTPVGIHQTRITPDFRAKVKSGPLAVGEPRDPIPFFALLEDTSGGGWYAGIEFSGRVSIDLKARGADNATVVDVDLGLENKEDLWSRVAPQENYQPPATFIGCFKGDMDDCGNRFRRWVGDELRPPVHDDHYPLLVNNSWGSGMQVDQKLARSMIDQSAELGLEMFHIDAGWFTSVGNWQPDPRKFPGGLAPIADYAHSKGLKFGLWVGWTQGGNTSERSPAEKILSVNNPAQRQWFPDEYPANWKPNEFSGATVCLADPDAEKWCLNLLRSIVKEDKIDMLEHDQRMIIDNCRREGHRHTTARVDAAFRAGEAYYRIYDTLRNENPNLLFEDCVNGGQMVDFGVVRRVHYISITDTYDPLSNRRAFYDASYVLPPAMCECYIEQHPGRTPANFLYMLRSGMMGWCTIMLDTTRWTPEQHNLAKRQFALYKSELRPLIRNADLYHVSQRPDGVNWDGIQYFDPKANRGVLFAFRGTTAEAEHRFVLRGLDPDAQYRVEFEDAGNSPQTAAGSQLMITGLNVGLEGPESSALAFIRKI